MAKRKRAKRAKSTRVEDYRHEEAKRKNNPPAKIAAEGTVPAVPKAQYAYNPHLPPVLRFDQEGKADKFAVDTPSRPAVVEISTRQAASRSRISPTAGS